MKRGGAPRRYVIRSTCGPWRVHLSARGIIQIALPPSPPSEGRLFDWLWIAGQREHTVPERQRFPLYARKRGVPPALRRLMVQIRQYFSGERERLIVPYVLQGGTPFMRKVWECMKHIPFGETRTYGDIADSAGSPRACRAVGNACAANPIPLVIPCHRVVAKRGVGGFSAGIEWKKFLLSIEALRRRASAGGGGEGIFLRHLF